MDEKLAAAGKETLVEIVKLAQKRGMKGSKGGWKEFLGAYDKKFGASLSDPTRRSADVLISFLKTFDEEDDVKVFYRVLQCYSNRDDAEQFKKSSSDSESPEQRLVRMTLEHLQYPLDYSLPSHEEEWLVIKQRKKSNTMRSTKMVAVDCEMVLCEDGSEALVRVCVVDRDLQVKLDELVNPYKPVADYRTDITGVSSDDFDGVTCSLGDVQKSMKKLLSHGTILVGHSLYNDLKALKIDHARVIDTSYIFKYEDGPNYRRPSLYNLCKSLLDFELRTKDTPHNCLDDACAAMKLVLAKIERGIENVIPLVHVNVPEKDLAKLLLHRIPVNVPSEKLHEIIPGDFTIELKNKKTSRGENYTAYAIFKTQLEANHAFESVEGKQEEDSSGRPQKFISFHLSTGEASNFYVRKMAIDSVQVESKKRSFQDEEMSKKSKKSKADQKLGELEETDHNQCDLHLREIEKLKRDLNQRDQEISNLNKLIIALTRKQGL